MRKIRHIAVTMAAALALTMVGAVPASAHDYRDDHKSRDHHHHHHHKDKHRDKDCHGGILGILVIFGDDCD